MRNTAAAAILIGSLAVSSVAHADGSFKRVARTAHIQFFAAKSDAVDAKRSEAFLQQLLALFPVSDVQIDFYRHSSPEQMQQAFGLPVSGLTNLASGRIDSVYSFHAHELVHAVAGRLGRTHVLFSEGLAVALSANGQVRGRNVDQTAREFLANRGSLDQLLQAFASQDPDTDYAVAASFVSFLLDRFGIDSMVRFLQGCQSPSSFRSAFKAAYGRSIADLEFEWSKSLRSNSSAPRAWYDASTWPASLAGASSAQVASIAD